MKKLVLLIGLMCAIVHNVSAQQNIVLDYIKNRSEVREGGCGIFAYNNTTYVICVSQIVVGNKNETTCKTIASTKAKRDMVGFVNGSEITSMTELKTSELTTESLSGSSHILNQEYSEMIKEKVVGHIDQCEPLGGWYSADRSVYYFAISKIINNK